MSEPKPNAELAYRVLDHIDAHPEQWDQGVFIGKADCGTVGCFAGWACLLSGVEPDWFYSNQTDTSYVRDSDGRITFAGERAEELLGVSRHVDQATEGDSEEDLFASYNSREDLGRLVEKIFGPRPGEHINCLHDPEQADGNPFAAMVCSPMPGGAS